jgi:hydrophobic/amphiphilic exporter-1 (mainly G- bacteria), HAE1 family
MSITEVAIKRPLLITVIFVTAILFGFISYRSLNYNLLPKFEANVVSVLTVYRGASSEEVRNNVTEPLEEAVAAIEGVDKISSSSQEGASVIIVQLKSGFSTTIAQRDAERRINLIKAQLPEGSDDPVVNRFSTDEIPVLRLSANGKLAPSEMYVLIDDKVRPILANVAGVGTVSLTGGIQREIQVSFDNDKLKAYGISNAQVNQVIAANSGSFPVGAVETLDARYTIRLDANLTSVEEISQLVLRENKDGSKVLLRDVASLLDGETTPTTLNRVNGKPGIGVEISKQADANAVKVSQEVKKVLTKLETTYEKEGLKFDIAIDQSLYTLASAEAVIEDLFLAVLIVALVMLLFLHSVRSSLFVLVSLPSAMIPTFILMYAFGFSLNLMTLMALSLVVGILVDDSIVVLENVYRHMEMGKDKRQAAIEGRAEIGFTALAITLVDVVVFVPLALSGGLIGNILREFSLVVVFSTLMSLVVSFTLTPLLISRWGRLEDLTKNTLWAKINRGFESIIDGLKDFYGDVLHWSLRHKRYILLGVAALFVGAVSLVPAGFIGAAFISQGDRGEFLMKLEASGQTPLYQTSKMATQVEEILLARPEVVKAFTNVGTQSGSGFGGGGTAFNNIAEITVQLVDKKDRKISADEFASQIRNEASKIPGLKVTVQPTGITGNSEAPIQIAVKGTNMDDIRKGAIQVRAIVAGTPGTDYVEFSTKSPKAEIEIIMNRDKMADLGISTPEVASAVQLSFRGNDQTKFKDAGEEYAINLSLDEGDRRNIDDIRSLSIRSQRGGLFRLDQIADIRETVGQTVLERTDRLNSIKINSAAVGRPSGTIVAEIKEKLKNVQLPSGVIVEYQGEAQRQGDAFGSLGLAMLLGILLVYLIMVALYESTIYPFVVLFSIPVALIGSLLALALSMENLTIFAIVGLIMLLGLVAKNGILLVDFTNQLKAEGRSLTEALVEAGKERLRPILMTTVAMIFGMLPIALASGAGAEVKNGMAWVIIGGLTSSLVLTLVLVPTVYYIVDRLKERVERLMGRSKPMTAEPAHV